MRQTCAGDKQVLQFGMTRLLTLVVVAAAALCLLASGCQTQSGSREFIPGKGWVPTD